MDGDVVSLRVQQEAGGMPLAEQHTVPGCGQVCRSGLEAVVANRPDRCLVDKICQIGPGKAGRPARSDRQVDVGGEVFAARMHREDGSALFLVRERHDYMAVEPAGP